MSDPRTLESKVRRTGTATHELLAHWCDDAGGVRPGRGIGLYRVLCPWLLVAGREIVPETRSNGLSVSPQHFLDLRRKRMI